MSHVRMTRPSQIPSRGAIGPADVQGQTSDLRPYRRPEPASQPEYFCPAYQASRRRSPAKPLLVLPHTLSEITGPVFGQEAVAEKDSDLTGQHSGAPLGERIIVSGRILDSNGRPVPHTLIEIWQANAAGRYAHRVDDHRAPLDPNFTGAGRTMTDENGHYQFLTIKPGAYPWQNHANAWRPAHIHFSLFGSAFATRLVTQMYFTGDPLLPYDPIFNSIPSEKARQRLLARFDWQTTQPEWALAYRFNIILRGREETPFEL